MDDFIKNNPINFIKDKHIDDDDGSNDNEREMEMDDDQDKNKDSPSDTKDDAQTIDTVIDADLTYKSTDFHTNNQSDEDTGDSGDDEDDDDDDDDDFILDPRDYDFLLRNLYYENIEEYERRRICIKYETFCKSDLKKMYTNDELKLQVSKRKLIGANLHMNSKKYNIDLNNPTNYFIVHNSVLGYYFLKWYMAETFDVVLQKNYSIFCIDNCIGMYTVIPGKKLLVCRESLKLVDDEAYREDDSDDDNDNDNDNDSDDKTDTDQEGEIDNEESTDICDIEVVECD